MSLNTLSVGKNFFYIFLVKCSFLSPIFLFSGVFVPWFKCCLHIRASNPLLQVFLPVCQLSFDFVYGVFITHRLLVCIVSNEFFMVSGFCVRFRASIILEY